MIWFLYLLALHALALMGIVWTIAWLIFHIDAQRHLRLVGKLYAEEFEPAPEDETELSSRYDPPSYGLGATKQ